MENTNSAFSGGQSLIDDILERGKKCKDNVSTLQRNIIFGVLMAVSLFYLGGVMTGIISGIITLVVLVVVGVVLFIGLRFLHKADPLIKMWTDNIILAKMIENAKTYKNETIMNRLLSSFNELQEKRETRTKIHGHLLKIESKLNESDKNSSTYPKKVEMFEKVQYAFDTIEKHVEQAGIVHRKLEVKVAEYKDMMEFTDIISDAMTLINEQGGDKLEEMLSMEAFAEIDTEFHEAMASIDSSIKDFEFDNGRV